MQRIINTVHPEVYVRRPGLGNAYSYIRSVEITDDSVKILLASLQAGCERSELEFKEPEIIAILPFLLNGDLAIIDALQLLEEFLRDKYKDNLPVHDIKTLFNTHFETKCRLSQLLWHLIGNNDNFAKLCQMFPHMPEDRGHDIYVIPVKVVNDEIIHAIKERFANIIAMNTFS